MASKPPETLDDSRSLERMAESSDATLGATDRLSESAKPARTGPAVAVGARIARYLVLQELGAGTMGVVYAAYDPELDRKIAIKLLKARSDEHASAARLQREAQALAKLNHRNVVAVYDVGVHEDQLFLAMEFVEGETLRDWMSAEQRSWTEVMEVMVEAGRGLAAAHGVGLIHRDFKPDNVMIHDNGRVRVMDFGLARAENLPGEEPAAESTSAELETLVAVSAAGPLTQTGTVMGTPGYMGRELFEGRSAGARSDQFAFCATFYEALYGERPFPGRTLYKLVQSVRAGRLLEPPREVRVPSWLHAIIVRGLSGTPEARFDSMLDLLEALEEAPRKRRRRWIGAAAGVALLAGLSWGVGVAIRDAQMCEGLDAPLAEVWSGTQRAAIERRFVASELSYAADAWTRVEQGLDHYADEWLAGREAACEALREGQQTRAQRRLRDACYEDRLQHLQATVSVLAEADAATVGRAAEMVANLPRVDRCADVEALALDALPLSGDEDASFEQRLAEAEALEKAGKYGEGLALVAVLEREARAAGDERVLARSKLREGVLQRRAGDYEAAEAALLAAYEYGQSLRMPAVAAEASAQLVFVVGYQLARHEDGRRWALHAKALARATGTDEAEALYLNNLGALAYGEAAFDETRELWEEALAVRERAHGSDHPQVAGSLNNLGVLAHDEGRYEQARAYHERALEIWAGAFGPEHPQTSYSLNHLGRVAVAQGRYEQARAYHERALAIREPALGPNHSLVADTLSSLGLLAEREGDASRALEAYARALGIYEHALGPEHPSTAEALTGKGRALLGLDRHAEARAVLERALAILEGGEGDPTRLAKTRLALAKALVAGESEPGPEVRARAQTLAEQAHAAFVAAGDKSAAQRAETEAWLESLGGAAGRG